MPDRIDLNAASAIEISELVDIEEEVADRIIQRRASQGSFQSLDDVADVEGIDARALERIREKMTV